MLRNRWDKAVTALLRAFCDGGFGEVLTDFGALTPVTLSCRAIVFRKRLEVEPAAGQRRRFGQETRFINEHCQIVVAAENS